MVKQISAVILILLLVITSFLLVVLFLNINNVDLIKIEGDTKVGGLKLVGVGEDLGNTLNDANEGSILIASGNGFGSGLSDEELACEFEGLCDYDDEEGGGGRECSEDSDCGDDGFVGDKFCRNGDVYRDYKEFSCDRGRCDDDIDEELIEECNYGCLNGDCITSDCVDNDGDDYDNCGIGDSGDDGNPVDCNDNDASVNPGADDSNCNGIDEDCDGVADDDYVSSLTSCGVGECSGNTGLIKCVNGQEINSCNAFEGSSLEICDGLDNDCDGSVDEEWLDLGNSCSVGIGECSNNGFKICSLNGLNSICSAIPGTPVNEICDDLDNDCDGEIDEGDVCYVPECRDNNDNDFDGLVDSEDPGCWDDLENPSSYNPELDDESRGGIECSLNSECGVNGLVGDRFCQGNDVYQDYRTHVCNNPGTGLSNCGFNDAAQKVDECNYGCEYGDCITSDCVDNDLDGYDTCNPGEPGDDGEPVDCNDDDDEIYPGAPELCDGKDNDCNGVANNGEYETFKFNTAWEIRTFVNNYSEYEVASTIWPNEGALNYDDVTANKVCELKGYENALNSTFGHWFSCYDNDVVYWDGNGFVTINACQHNLWINTLVCERSCVVLN